MRDISGAGIGDLTIKKCLDLFFEHNVIEYPTNHIRTTPDGLCPLQAAADEPGNSYCLKAQEMGLSYDHAQRLIFAADVRPFTANNKTNNLRLAIEKRMEAQHV